MLNFSNTTNRSNVFNSSSNNFIRHSGYSRAEPVEIVFLIFLMAAIITGNSLVCMAFSTVERKLRTVTNYFVINLAVSDILVGTFSLSLWLCLRTGTIQYSTAAGKVYVAFDILCGAASILNLTIISIERTFAVTCPAKHRNLSRNRPIIYGGIASVWLISLILALSLSNIFQRIKHSIIILVILIFLIPTIVIICSYVMIFHAVKTRIFQHKTFRNEVRLAVMIGIVIVLFLLCWFPFFLFNILADYCSCWSQKFIKLIPAVKYLHYTNSTMNPLIYAYRNADYRRAFKKILFHVFTCGRAGNFDKKSDRAASFRSTLPSQGVSATREEQFNDTEKEKSYAESSSRLLNAKQVEENVYAE